MFVVRHRRRRGLGRQAVEILRSQFRSKTKRRTVEVLVANERAIAFWRAVGYTDYCLRLESSDPTIEADDPVGETAQKLRRMTICG